MCIRLLHLVLTLTATLGLTSSGAPATIEQWDEIRQKCAAEPDGGTTFRTMVGLSSDCRIFSRCPDPFFLQPVVESCAVGSLFDDVKSFCNFAHLVDCDGRFDPCFSQRNGFIVDVLGSTANRTASLQCLNGRTVSGGLCGICEFFNPNSGCVVMDSCVKNVPVQQSTGCSLEEDPENPQGYIAVGPGTRTPMNCGQGTVFSQEDCNCIAETVLV